LLAFRELDGDTASLPKRTQAPHFKNIGEIGIEVQLQADGTSSARVIDYAYVFVKAVRNVAISNDAEGAGG